MTLLTDGDDIIAKVQAPRVEEVVEVPAEIGEGAPEGRRGRRDARIVAAPSPATRPRADARRSRPDAGASGGSSPGREHDREAHRHLLRRQRRETDRAAPAMNRVRVSGSRLAMSVSSWNSTMKPM